MSEVKDLLIEIGVEELPPKSLQELSESFKTGIAKGLQVAELSYDTIQSFATPRRLALLVSKLASKQPNKKIAKRGPAKAAALDKNEKPTPALLGFATACGVTVKELTLEEGEKGAFFVHHSQSKGRDTAEILPEILKTAVHQLPLPKRMRWGTQTESFVRPVHWLLILFGNDPLSAELFGIRSDRYSRGHRFHHPEKINVPSANTYEELLLTEGKVRADFEKRKHYIQTEMQQHIHSTRSKDNKHKKDQNTQNEELLDENLLDEVTGLVEWPVILVGHFAEHFLKLPKEVLISSMKTHQRCFPLEDGKGGLLPKFLITSNIESVDPATVRCGNEAVIVARLSDAEFYYKIDKEKSLQDRLEDLSQVVFQKGLGSLKDKALRLQKLSKIIAEKLSLPSEGKAAERAALLSKSDLLTQMVGEFPELQGIMGHYYALNDGESKDVALAIEEHYRPRFAEDSLPNSQAGSIVALADRIDSLTGIFGLGKRPTGEKDPYGLRRQALGVLRILIENRLSLDLKELFEAAQSLYGNLLPAESMTKPSMTTQPMTEPLLTDVLLAFCFDRLRAWYQDQNVRPQVFEAVLAKKPTKPWDFHQRILAVTEFSNLAEAESLSAANKRVHNILAKADLAALKNNNFDAALLQAPEEMKLATVLNEYSQKIQPLLEKAQYTEALKLLANLKEPIDLFFDKVMVMVEDPKLRQNRIQLLQRLRSLFLEIADISLL